MTDSILDDLFQGCALTAFLEQAHAQQGWPDAEATRRRAYELYEQALAQKNGQRPLPEPECQSLTTPAKCARIRP
jgi:hypothetical protein